MPSIKFDITGDNKQLVASLQQAQQVIGKTIDQLNAEGGKIDKIFTDASEKVDKAGTSIKGTLKKIGKAVGAYFAAEKVKDFIGEIMNVRKEFEQLQISFSTLLGSDVLGKKMFDEITQFATTTPMLEKDLASAAQTMLGFNIQAEKVMPLLKQMGDISMGDSQKLQSLSLAFSQAASTGKLMGQDLLQMINAGFNPLAEISRTTGRSMAELKDDMSAGKITIDMLEGAFKSATAEGGKFHGMLNKMADSAAGAFSNLEGAMQKFYNEIGTELEAPLVSATNSVTASFNFMAEHAKEVVSALSGLIAAVGTYKAACILVAASQNKLSIATQLYTAITSACQKAVRLLNLELMANPYVAAATAITAIVAGCTAWYAQTNKVTAAQSALAKVEETAAEEADKQKAKIESLSATLHNNKLRLDQREKALRELQTIVPAYNAQLTSEGRIIRDNTKALKEYCEQLDRSARLKAAQSLLTETYEKRLKAQRDEAEAQKKLNEKRKAQQDAATDVGVYSNDTSYEEKMVKDAKKRHKDANDEIKALKELIESDSVETSGKGGGSKAEQANKETLEAQKKNLQQRLDRMLPADAKGKAGAEIKRRIKAIDKEINDAYSINSGSTASYKSNNTRIAKAEARDTQKLNDEQIKYNEQLSRQKAQAILEARQYEINAMVEGRDRKLKQIQLDYDKEKQAIKDGIADTKKANEEAARQLWEAQNPNAADKGQNWENTGKVGKNFDLTNEQKNLYQQREKANDASYARQLEEQRKLDEQYQNEYLKKYGNVQEQRLAIAKEYNQKIADMQAQGVTNAEIETIKADKGAALSNFDAEQIKKSINWDVIYGNLEGLNKVTLEHARDQLQQFIDTSKNLSPADIKDLYTALESLNDRLDMTNIISAFKNAKEQAKIAAQEVIDARKQLDAASQENSAAQLSLGIADMQVSSAQKDADNAKKTGDTIKFAAAQLQLNNAIEKRNKAQEKVTATTKKLGDAEANYQKKQGKAIEAEAKAKKSGDKLRNGLAGLAGQMSSLGDALGGTAGELLSFGSSAISAFNATSKGIETIKEDAISLESAVAILAIIQAAFTAISEAANILGLGGDSAATKQAKALADQYSAMKDIWDELIEKKQEYINISYGSEAKNAYDDATKYLTNEIEYARKAAAAQLSAGASAGSHSYGYRMWQGSYKDENGRNWQDVASEISKAIGTNISGMDSFTKLNAQQLQYIKENYVGLWASMDDTFRGYMQDIIDAEDKAKALGDSLNEALTAVSFDDFYDNFTSLMSNMDADASTFADNFEEYLRNAILQSLLANKYKSKIEALYKSWTQAADTNGDGINDMTAEETKQLREAESLLAQEMLADRDNLMATFGLSTNSSQKATAEGIQNITADQADQLVGRITAMQIAVEQSKDSTVMLSTEVANGVTQLLSISSGVTSANKNLSDMLLQLQTTNSYLYDIADRNKKMYNEWSDKLEAINQSIKNS